MHFLITRPQPDADNLAKTLKARGHQCTISPLIELEYLTPPALDLTDAQAIIITSRNALRAISRHPKCAELIGLPLNLVGQQTAKLAEEIGFKKIGYIAENAEELASHIKDNSKPAAGKFLYLTGEHLSFDIATYLENHHFKLKRTTLYRAKSIGELNSSIQKIILDDLVDGVILLSPRTAKIYTKLIQKHHLTDHARKPTHYCLSENVGDALSELAPVSLQIPDNPNLAALLALIRDNS